MPAVSRAKYIVGTPANTVTLSRSTSLQRRGGVEAREERDVPAHGEGAFKMQHLTERVEERQASHHHVVAGPDRGSFGTR